MKTKKHFRELSKDFAVYGIMSALSQMSGLLLLPLFTRIFSIDEYGLIDIIAVFVSLLSVFMGLALTSALIRYFSEVSDPRERASFISTLFVATLGFGLLILLGVSFLAPILAGGLLNNKEYGYYIQLGGWIALVATLVSIPQNVLRMERRIITYNLLGLTQTILYLSLALYFVLVLTTGVWGVFTAQLVSNIIILILALVFTRQHLTSTLLPSYLKRAFRYSLPLLPHHISTWINSQTDRLLLLMFLGLSGVAVFGAAGRIAKVIVFLLLIFQMGWTPYSMAIIHEEGRNEVYRRMFNYYTGVFAVLALGVTVVSPELFSILLPAEYQDGYKIIPWVVGAAIVHKSGALTKLGVLISGKTSIISLISVTAILLNILIAFFLIRGFGVTGAAIGSFITQLLFTGALWRFSLKQSDVRFDTKAILVVLSTYIMTSILFLIIAGQLINPVSAVVRLFLFLAAAIIISYCVVDRPVLQFLSKFVQKSRFSFNRT